MLVAIRIILIVVLSWITSTLSGQHTFQWWQPDQDYYKFCIDTNAVFQLRYQDLIDAGIPSADIVGSDIALFSMGEEVPIYVSTEGTWTTDDYLVFVGEHLDGGLDQHLYPEGESAQLNPKVSLFGSCRPYFLTLAPDKENLRYSIDTPDSQTIPHDYYRYQSEIVFQSAHQKPIYNGRDFIRHSYFDRSEGMGSDMRAISTVKIPTPQVATSDRAASLHIRLGGNAYSEELRVTIDDELLRSLAAPAYRVVDFMTSLPQNILVGKDSITIGIENKGHPQGLHSIASISISYDRQARLEQLEDLRINAHNTVSPGRFIIRTNGDVLQEESAFVFDPVMRRMQLLSGRGTRDVQWMPSQEPRTIYYSLSENWQSVGELSPVQMQHAATADYIVITTRDQHEEARAYAAYRATEAGGSHTTAVVSIEDLTNAYAWGVTNHPMAIMEYAAWAKQQDKVPAYVFLIGKAYEYPLYFEEGELLPESIVPTYGAPGSDFMLVNGYELTEPLISVGRLAARNGKEINDYLRKVKRVEQNENNTEDWKKSIIHLSGGSADIQELIYGYLSDLGDEIAFSPFGADVKTFRKVSADPLQTATSQEIIDGINAGAGILTFFGHSAVGTFDFSLERPGVYDNVGRNPLIVSLGCHSGNIHTFTRGVSEAFVLEPDRGALAFVASSGTAYTQPQYSLGKLFYENYGDKMAGASIGKMWLDALRRRYRVGDLANTTLVQQFTLHGDPAIRGHYYDAPDYSLVWDSIQVADEILASDPQITVDFTITNLGSNVAQELTLWLIHEYSNGARRDTHTLVIPAPAFQEKISWDIDNPGRLALGYNNIYIQIDPRQQALESTERSAILNNNRHIPSISQSRGFEFYMLDRTATTIYPEPFAIMHEADQIELIAALNNTLQSTPLELTIEIDTTAQFDSPLRQFKAFSNTRNTIAWRPAMEWRANQVYYWRVVTTGADSDTFINRGETSSFIYLPSAGSGWNQSHFYQWSENTYEDLVLDTTTRLFRFAPRSWDIRIKNRMKDPNDFWVFVNNSPWRSLNPKALAPGIQIFAWHPEQVIVSNQADNGSVPYSTDGYVFKTESREDRANIAKLLRSLPAGSRVFIHSMIEDLDTDLHIDKWESDKAALGYSLFDVFEELGATRVRELINHGTVPFTIIAEKGRGLIAEDYGVNISSTVDLSSVVETNGNAGQLSSTRIGPASSWQRLEWGENAAATDISNVEIWLEDTQGNSRLWKSVTSEKKLSLADIDAARFPFMQLRYTSQDSLRSAPQLTYWRVLYEKLPDLHLTADLDLAVEVMDTLEEGDLLTLEVSIKNIASTPIDPVFLQYRISDEAGEQQVILSRLPQLSPQQEIRRSTQISTEDLSGNAVAQIEVNPRRRQGESSYINNRLQKQIYVKSDRIGPVLSVTFDGLEIDPFDRVRAQPYIEITINDKGGQGLLDDPELLTVQILMPDSTIRVYREGDEDVIFIPAQSPDDNTARMILTTEFMQSGIHTLLIDAEDQRGNKLSAGQYSLPFEVIDESTADYFNVYPNPFIDQLNFEFTFRNNSIPAVFDFYLFDTDGDLIMRVDKASMSLQAEGINTLHFDQDSPLASLPAGVYYYRFVNSQRAYNERQVGAIVKLR